MNLLPAPAVPLPYIPGTPYGFRMTGAHSTSANGAEAVWATLDEPWREAFRQAWEAVCTGNIGVGAVVSDPEGRIVHASRNRVSERDAPPGEVAGSSIAHAEINALARLRFRSPREFVLTTTLQPCLQCSAAIRMAPVAQVRIAGADRLWDGCGDFTSLNPWVARRPQVPTEGPRLDELGTFAVLMSRLGLGVVEQFAQVLVEHGEGPILALADDLQRGSEIEQLKAMPVEIALSHLWDRLPTSTLDAGH
jgi:tRNA(Arg) A34 adenosine deaminase TadA